MSLQARKIMGQNAIAFTLAHVTEQISESHKLHPREI